MARIADVSTGDRFGLLTVESRAGRKVSCRCECGNLHVSDGYVLLAGKSNSCGCLKRSLAAQRARRHGMTGSPEHWSWKSMLQRCLNPNYAHFCDYGGRGITVCDRWLTFENFFEDMGIRPEGTTLDRIDNSDGYHDGNCRWASDVTQARNSRHNHLFTHNGQTHCITEWAEILGIDKTTLHLRIKRGLPIDKVLSATPLSANWITRRANKKGGYSN